MIFTTSLKCHTRAEIVGKKVTASYFFSTILALGKKYESTRVNDLFRSRKFEKTVFEVNRFDSCILVAHFTELVVSTVRHKRSRKADISSNIVH